MYNNQDDKNDNVNNGIEKVKELVRNNKKAIALCVAVAFAVGTVSIIYNAVDDNMNEDSYANAYGSSGYYLGGFVHVGGFYDNNYYISRGANYRKGTWSTPSGYSGSSISSSGSTYSGSRAGGMIG